MENPVENPLDNPLEHPEEFQIAKRLILSALFDPRIHAAANIPEKDRWAIQNFAGLGICCDKKKDASPISVLVRVKLDSGSVGAFDVKPFLTKIKALSSDLKVKGGQDKQDLDVWDLIDTAKLRVEELGAIASVGGLAGPVNQLTIGSDVAMAGRAIHGTVCGFARVEDCSGTFLLSAGHVLDSHNCTFSLVTSRGAVVARVARQTDLFPGPKYGPNRQQDAVLARLLDGVDPNYELPGKMGLLSSGAPQTAYCNMQVTKTGKTVREGTVKFLKAAILVDYPSQRSWLDDQIIVRGNGGEIFAQAGDSGALVVARVSHCHEHHHEPCEPDHHGHHGHHGASQLLPVGMVIAAGDVVRLDDKKLPVQYSVVSPMQDILCELKAELIAGGFR